VHAREPTLSKQPTHDIEQRGSPFCPSTLPSCDWATEPSLSSRTTSGDDPEQLVPGETSSDPHTILGWLVLSYLSCEGRF
jgi:hypothetical protein